jgi:hypothetical protein
MNGLTTDLLLRRHLQMGWWALLIFLSLGAVLELLHAVKMGFYLDVSNETRRLLWTLSHAHGGLISIVHIGFAATLALVPQWTGERRLWASRCLIAALVLVPGGFFLGGLFIHDGDPGLGILLLPPGAALFFTGVLLTAWGIRSAWRDGG